MKLRCLVGSVLSIHCGGAVCCVKVRKVCVYVGIYPRVTNGTRLPGFAIERDGETMPVVRKLVHLLVLLYDGVPWSHARWNMTITSSLSINR